MQTKILLLAVFISTTLFAQTNLNEKKLDKKTLSKALKLVGDFLEKNVLKPNNINYPISRLHFVNILK